jgi:hypothetical protein
MNVADLIAELQKLPPHLQVACALDVGETTEVDVEGREIRLNVMKACDCYAATYLENMGTWVRLVADGPHFGGEP